ncbi:MAG: amidohydrolase family protein [FCB group bacterium]|nr:amidohydrolase family protein [FCB group bacterium]
MKGQAKCYEELREYCETVPLVDCHDHSVNLEPKYKDPILALKSGYFNSDIHSVTSEDDFRKLDNTDLSLEKRWPILEKAWKKTCHTGYAQVTRRVLKKFYGEDELTLAALKRMQGRLLDLSDEKTFDGILEEANIAVRLEDVWPNVGKVIRGTLKLTPRSRLVISLPRYHKICNYEDVQANVAPLGNIVDSLDAYLETCREIFKAHKKFGAVAFKDQSAYDRTLDYGNPTRTEAETIFNWFMEDPRRKAAYPNQTKPLDDYLFHEFMRMARDLNLPVQIHTGHMAGIRNDIVKANAILLTKVIELHRDVRFDLFHANWPYSGELLFLCKNYPNVTIDFCWANIIDPVYCQNMFKQALSCVPHGKIHGYGSDFVGCVDRTWAHAQIARENIAIALSDMVDIDYLSLDEAKEVAHRWLFTNANNFYRLGL